MMTAEPARDTEAQAFLDMLRESATDYCARALPVSRLRPLRAAGLGYDRARWREMADLGWSSILAPAGAGGLGLGAAAIGALCENLGSVVAPEPILECAGAAVSILASLDVAPELLTAIAAGESIVIVPVRSCSEQSFSRITATRDARGFALQGRVAHVPLAQESDIVLVPALLDGEPALFRVTTAAVGMTCDLQTLADGSCHGRLSFDRCRVEVSALLGVGRVVEAAMTRATELSRLAAAAYLNGLADALLKITIAYVSTRQQFGQTIASFQVVQHRLVDLYLKTRLTTAAVRDCLDAFDATSDSEQARCASRACYRACETALAVVREAVQLHGGIGYTEQCDVVLYLNRALVLSARYGNAAQHAARIAGLDRNSAVSTPLAARRTPIDPNLIPAEGDWNGLANEDFRAVIRAWFEANYPAALRHPSRRLHWSEVKPWHRQLCVRGWAAPAWPREHGGMGLSPEKLLIYIEERERWGVARTPDQGILMVGPLLMEHGTAAQRAMYLSKALSGEHIWCQGYSEPNAGSDLASLRTTADRDGDHFVVNGQKTWTTLAQDATHMYCLVRTDRSAKPQAGISFLLIDLTAPGITIRPIRNLAGHEEFCEVFFDNVRVPAQNLVGILNQGWTIAKALLGFERIFIGSPKTCQYALHRLEELGAALDLAADPVFVDKFTRLKLDVQDLESLYKEFADVVRRGERLGADVSLLKIWASETYQRLSECLLETAGEAGATLGTLDFNGTRMEVLSHYYGARPTTIYGGANEVQRNILAKQILNLPAR
ncbi:MAG: acyl-CoA dehydrogenase family protein [Gammaproteobacteria bacterium]|nr:acyl-CoA dehydrogenase family protein [Gammaproteobacteria bacterium]